MSENKKIGITSGNNIKEIIEDLRKDMGIPEDDIIIILHTKRKEVEKLKGALELVGYKGQIGALRPTNRV